MADEPQVREYSKLAVAWTDALAKRKSAETEAETEYPAVTEFVVSLVKLLETE